VAPLVAPGTLGRKVFRVNFRDGPTDPFPPDPFPLVHRCLACGAGSGLCRRFRSAGLRACCDECGHV